jgi:hypothetical protein
MLTDLRYAMRQLDLCRDASHCGRLDCLQRAQDALHRCLAAAEASEVLLDEATEELDAAAFDLERAGETEGIFDAV